MSTGVKTHRITDPNDDTRFVDVDPYVIDGIARAQFATAEPGSFRSTPYSFNNSSCTDNGTGDFTVNFTNDFGDLNTIPTSNVFASNGAERTCGYAPDTVGAINAFTYNNGSLDDGPDTFCQVAGRLA
jgi:hypothetical protein